MVIAKKVRHRHCEIILLRARLCDGLMSGRILLTKTSDERLGLVADVQKFANTYLRWMLEGDEGSWSKAYRVLAGHVGSPGQI